MYEEDSKMSTEEPNDTFHIMAIDPGSRNIGVCIYELTGKLELVSIATHNLNVDIPDSADGIHENLLDRMCKLSKLIRMILHIYNPYIIAMESSFINMNRMGAVIPLSKSIHTIETTIYGVDKHAKIISIPPGVIKKVFGSNQVGKDAVLSALNGNDKILSKLDRKKDITEHEVDAIAIAFTLLEYIKTTGGMVCIRYLKI